MSDAKPSKTSKRPDGYENQLSDQELFFLHSSLQEARIPLEELAQQLPPWREGRFTGQQPTKSTLSNIRKRMEMEAGFIENEATTASLMEQVRKETPGISLQEVQTIGYTHFLLQSLRDQDPATFLKYQMAHTHAQIEMKKLELRERESKRQEEALALDKQRFMRETTELFVKYAKDAEALRLATQPGISNDERTELLGQKLFGELWRQAETK